MAEATQSMKSVPGDRCKALMPYFALRFVFSRRLRWTTNFASGALRPRIQQDNERERELAHRCLGNRVHGLDLLIICSRLPKTNLHAPTHLKYGALSLRCYGVNTYCFSTACWRVLHHRLTAMQTIKSVVSHINSRNSHLPSKAKTTLLRGWQRRSMPSTSLKMRCTAALSFRDFRRETCRICHQKQPIEAPLNTW